MRHIIHKPFHACFLLSLWLRRTTPTRSCLKHKVAEAKSGDNTVTNRGDVKGDDYVKGVEDGEAGNNGGMEETMEGEAFVESAEITRIFRPLQGRYTIINKKRRTDILK